jgi:hypothetical protein
MARLHRDGKSSCGLGDAIDLLNGIPLVEDRKIVGPVGRSDAIDLRMRRRLLRCGPDLQATMWRALSPTSLWF